MSDGKLAILAGGGPAPGINSVISAATIRGRLEGVEVIGIRDGFQWLMQGDIDHVVPLTIADVSRVHYRGGSFWASPARIRQRSKTARQDTAVAQRLGISQLITIGGDDTAFSAMKLAQRAEGRLRVVHVPKTIDNDLDLPVVCGHVRLSDRAASRRGDRAEPDGRCKDDVALVFRDRDGPHGGTSCAGDRQSCGRDTDAGPRGVPAVRPCR